MNNAVHIQVEIVNLGVVGICLVLLLLFQFLSLVHPGCFSQSIVKINLIGVTFALRVFKLKFFNVFG